MNIKQAEKLSGVSKRNIRFYEQEGLISPARNRENDYREYTQADIDTLKRIRVLRMVDMPLEQIKAILQGQTSLEDASTGQILRLKKRARELDTAIRFCQELASGKRLDAIDVDAVLARMDSPQNKPGLFNQWIDDYKKVAAVEHSRFFTFVPETPVTTAREFTFALCQYGNENNLDLVITKEGMYPEFTIDGIEYTAERFYAAVQGIPVATIRCSAKHPEEFEADVPQARKFWMKLLHYAWLPLAFLLINLAIFLHTDWISLFSTWEGWLIILSILAISGAMLYRSYLFYYNHSGKPEKKK